MFESDADPEWVLEISVRAPNPQAHSPTVRTLSDGWASEDVLPRPDLGPDVPLAMIDFVDEARIYDRADRSAAIPVFSRNVVLNREGRMRGCWSALGVPLGSTG